MKITLTVWMLGVTPQIFLSAARPFLGAYNLYRVDER